MPKRIGVSDQEDLAAKIDLARETFFFGIDAVGLEELKSISCVADTAAQEIARSFLHNIQRASTVASVPFQLAHSAVYRNRLSLLQVSERIRARAGLPPGGELPNEQILLADTRAEEKLLAESRVLQPDGLPYHAHKTLVDLYNLLSNKEFSDAAKDLLHQSIISVWGTLEVCANQVVIELLNRNPQTASRVLREMPAKRHVPANPLSVNVIEAFNFDVSRSMGDIIFGENNISSLEAIRDIFAVIAEDNSPVHAILADQNLWKLWQQRHVIVHRRGIVDKTYVTRIGADASIIGSHLPVTSIDLEKAFTCVTRAGTALVNFLT